MIIFAHAGKRIAETLAMDYYREHGESVSSCMAIYKTCTNYHSLSAQIIFFYVIQIILATEVRIIRIFNTYGPRMALDDGRVVSNFVAQALTGECNFDRYTMI